MKLVSKKLIDSYGRRITYLRLSVTDKCNVNCTYCNPFPGNKSDENSILSFDEILKVVNSAAKVGISKVRLTGGEPLLREDLFRLIEKISDVPGIKDISLTTNGILLPNYSEQLRDAGLKRINISLDSLSPETYKKINGGNIQHVLQGIKVAKNFFEDVRINMVVLRGINDNEICDFIEFGRENKLTIRFLEYMLTKNACPAPRPENFGNAGADYNQLFVSTGNSFSKSLEYYKLKPIDEKSTAEWFLVNGGPQKIGFISPTSNPFCYNCNRIRLTSTGELIPCLHDDTRISLREALKSKNYKEEIIKLFFLAAKQKKLSHQLDKGKTSCEMKSIGG